MRVKARLVALAESVRTGFWAIPATCIVLAVLLALLLVRVDRATTVAHTFRGGPDGARDVLSAIGTSMITFTGLVFSITIVVLQLTSSQYSPRVLRTFLRDRHSQVSLGVFVATFVYAVTVLRTVSSVEDANFVPSIATSVGVVLLLASIAVFVSYIHHIAVAIQVSSILAGIGEEARQAVDRRYPPGRPASTPAAQRPSRSRVSTVIPAPRPGVLTRIDVQGLVDLAGDADVVLVTDVVPGRFLPQGAPLVSVVGEPEALDLRAVLACFSFGRERTMREDPSFGLRQMVDIAERALSPGINDPTTAVQALDQIHDLLRRLATRPLQDGLHVDPRGDVRLVAPPETFGDYLQLGLEEIEQYGREAVQVQRRLVELRRDLAGVALPEHRGALGLGQRSTADEHRAR